MLVGFDFVGIEETRQSVRTRGTWDKIYHCMARVWKNVSQWTNMLLFFVTVPKMV